MGDIIDEIGNTMPVPGNGRAKRARIDREGNMVVAGDIYGYNKTVNPPIRYLLGTEQEFQDFAAFGGIAQANPTDPAVGAANSALLASLISQFGFKPSVYFTDGTYQFNSMTIPAETRIIGTGGNVIFQIIDGGSGFTLETSVNFENILVYGTGSLASPVPGSSLLVVTGDDVELKDIIMDINLAAETGVIVSGTGNKFHYCTLKGTTTALSITGGQLTECDHVNFEAATTCVTMSGSDTHKFSDCVYTRAQTAIDFGSIIAVEVIGALFRNVVTRYANRGAGTTFVSRENQSAAIPDDASGAANQATVNLMLAAMREWGMIA